MWKVKAAENLTYICPRHVVKIYHIKNTFPKHSANFQTLLYFKKLCVEKNFIKPFKTKNV